MISNLITYLKRRACICKKNTTLIATWTVALPFVTFSAMKCLRNYDLPSAESNKFGTLQDKNGSRILAHSIDPKGGGLHVANSLELGEGDQPSTGSLSGPRGPSGSERSDSTDLESSSRPTDSTYAEDRQEAQLMLTTGSTRLAVSRGQQTWYHSTCYI